MAFKPTSEDLRLCAAVARTSSLANAARALGINQSTAFRRLNALEDGLGVRLFERLPEGYVTTNAGARLLEVAERVVADIDDVSREIAGQDLELSGSVRLTTTDDLALEAIPPILADFARQHPQVCVELMVEARTYDMHRREAEIAIRVSPAPPEQLIGRHVADVGVRIYAAEALLERYGDDCLDRAPWIGWQEGAGPTASWMATNVHADRIVAKANVTLGIYTLAQAAAGLALLPCYVGDLPNNLRRVGGPDPVLTCPLWVLTHRNLKQNARVRALSTALADGLRKRQHFLSGR